MNKGKSPNHGFHQTRKPAASIVALGLRSDEARC